MHYYKRNLGDYAKKAGRLTMLQHGAYNLLLDACYDRERFPTRDEAIDWAWASSAAEIEAVEFVLRKFFTLVDGVYVQERIRQELEDFATKSAKNKQIAHDRETKRARNVDEASPVVDDSSPNQEPRTKNQKKQKRAVAALPPSSGDADEPQPLDPICQVVLDAYHRHLPNCQPAHTLTPKRKRQILAANKLARKLIDQKQLDVSTAEFWDGYFTECSADPWLAGTKPNPNNPRWRQNIDILLREDQFSGIMDAALARDLGAAA